MDPGSIVGDKYRVGRTIGRGGMGVIVEAIHLQLGTSVAIKVLRANIMERPEVAERFLREARAAAQLRNEHICRVHDYGTLPDGAPFMVMELLEGRDLGTLVDQEGPLSPELVAHYLLQTCSGIAEPHARGMVHRDLKPGNLFLEVRPDGAPFIKILDFGIAKFESSDFKLTETRSVVGSPSYMAPEQLKSSKLVDTRTDIWGLGVVMYELLTEKLPFLGDSMPELVLAIASEPPMPLPSTKIPNELAAIVYRCLDKDPNERFQSVAELADALVPFANLDAKQLASSAAAMLAKKPGAGTKAGFVIDELLAKETNTLHAATGAIVTRTLPRATFGLAAALVVALGIIIVMYTRRPEADQPAAVPKPAADAAMLSTVAPDAAMAATVAPDAAPPDAAEPIDATVPDAGVPKKKHHTQTHGVPNNPDLTKSRF